METIELSAPGGVRLDKLIADGTELSRSAAVKLIEQGNVLVNGSPAGKKDIPAAGSAVEITLPEPQSTDILPENIPLDIVYEDDDLLVVNKPKGMVVHPAAGHYSGTLVNALMFHCGDSLSGINGEIRPGIVHRIDKDTSGLLMVAKNDLAHIGLSEQIKEHSFTREYETVVCGGIKEDGIVNAPIGRHKTERKKMCVTTENSREAVTHYFVMERFPGVHSPAGAPGDRANSSDTRPHGVHRAPGSRGSGLPETGSRHGLRDSASTRRRSGLFTRAPGNTWSSTASFRSISRNF